MSERGRVMMDSGRELAEITAGLDQLYRSLSSGDGFLNAEGLIPVSVAPVDARSFTDYAEARDALASLAERVTVADIVPLRRDYVLEMVDSLDALIDTFEAKPISFADRLRRQIRIEPGPVSDEILGEYRMAMRQALDELGFRDGDLATDICRWEEARRVAPDDVISVLRVIMVEARQRTVQTMYDFSQEWIEPVGVTDKPFSAYCDYLGRKVLLNLDFPYTTYDLKHLATHEAFPGHLVHLGLREAYVNDGIMPLDGAQVVTSSASSALFEGIADNGMAFLDWDDTPDDAVAIALQRLRSALRCNAAWMMHQEGKLLEDIVPAIAEAGFQSAKTVSGRLAFLSHGLRAPFVYAYWAGERAVDAVWQSVAREERPTFWAALYGQMHTPSTLPRFRETGQ
ncbi:hypothetical protein [Martelella alba]|nr:hypothetical protein [Martelella alba]